MCGRIGDREHQGDVGQHGYGDGQPEHREAEHMEPLHKLFLFQGGHAEQTEGEGVEVRGSMAHDVAIETVTGYHVDMKRHRNEHIWRHEPDVRSCQAVDDRDDLHHGEEEYPDSVRQSRQVELPAQHAPYEVHDQNKVESLDYFRSVRSLLFKRHIASLSSAVPADFS